MSRRNQGDANPLGRGFESDGQIVDMQPISRGENIALPFHCWSRRATHANCPRERPRGGGSSCHLRQPAAALRTISAPRCLWFLLDTKLGLLID